MIFLKALVLLLASVEANFAEVNLVSKKARGQLSLIGTRSGTNANSAHRLEAHHNPRTLAEKEKLEAYHDKLIRDRVPITHASLEKNHPDIPSAGTNPKNNNPKRNLRQSSQRITVESLPKHQQACDGIRKIVQCKDNVPEEVCKAELVKVGVQVLSDMPRTVFFAICVDSEAEAGVVAALTDVDGIEDDPPRTLSVVKESIVKRDLQASQQETPYGITLVRAPEFWGRYNGKQGDGIKVCVIDTGLLLSHEDIRDGDVTGTDQAELVTPWSEDGASHGTHVAGTIAAQDNDRGVVGVAPQASLHIVRVFDSTAQFTASSLVVAMNACGEAGANIVSMSLGGPTPTYAERVAIRSLHSAGVLFVAASGNDANGNNFVEYPAAYEHVLSVGAVNQFSQVADFSTHNPAVDIAAPGVDVVSLGSSNDRTYASASGTSMAAPHVAGVAALVWSQFPEKSVTEIEQALVESARDLGACGQDRLTGHGLVDAVAAAEYLEGGTANSENAACVAIKVSLKTDDFGDETTYMITSEDDASAIFYRGGPYPNDQRATYEDSISLPDGCYSLKWLDSYGDGSNNPDSGIGEIALDYAGSRQVSSNDLSEGEADFRFGNCVAGGAAAPVSAPVAAPVSAPVTAPVSAPVSAPVTAPVTAPVAAPVDAPAASPTLPTTSCAEGEAFLQLSLTTDRWALSENQLFLFEASAPDDEFIWERPRFSLRGETEYAGTACVQLQECNKFYFIDEYGDGLEDGSSLTLTLDGVVILEVLPGDLGEIFEEGQETSYWFQQFGNCPAAQPQSNRWLF